MPIKIPSNLPAFKTLAQENIFVMSTEKAQSQDIRPLRVAIVNLMPTKIVTETQLLRLLSNTPIQVDITLIKTKTHNPKNTSQEHLFNFYTTFDEIKDEYYDGIIITGAPVELLDFEAVRYWKELCDIMEWSKSHCFSTLHICWAAYAGLYYHYGIQKRILNKKMFGIFSHKVNAVHHPLLNGFDDEFMVPHSRSTEISMGDIENHPNLALLAYSDLAGAYMITDKTNRQIFLTGHAEYDLDTLKTEYMRDLEKGLPIEKPYNYFPDDNPNLTPKFTWRGHSSLMYSNWLNFMVYQETPYDLTKIIPL